MKCPYCLEDDTDVIDTRPASDAVRRRRECSSCSKRFTTYERTEMLDLSVIKKDGTRELFDRNKMLRGILKACEKRPVKAERLQQMADEIELALRRQDRTEIHSRKIGELVMEQLRQIDEVAYVRFASVYRRFRDAQQFAHEVARLKNARALPAARIKMHGRARAR